MGFCWAKRGLLVIVFMCACVCAAGGSPAGALQSTGDGSWFWQIPQPQGNELSSVCFSDATTAWAVGGAGTLLKSVDGGQTWVAQRFPMAAELTGIAFLDARNGWIVGTAPGDDVSDQGVVFRTYDGGATWERLAIVARGGLREVAFTDDRHGWAVGWWGDLYQTSDGGATWVVREIYGWIDEVEFTDATHGWAADDNGGLWRTSDAGLHWTLYPRFRNWNLQAISFSDERHGWVVAWDYYAKDAVFVTDDGGAHWRRRLAVDEDLVTGAFADATHGFVYERSGDWRYGTVHMTTDGGATWRVQRFSADPGWAASAMSSGGAMILVGQGIMASPGMDGDWTSRQSGPDEGVERLQFVDERTGWAVGGSRTLLHTADGVSWRAQLILSSSTIAAYRFTSAADGWLASAAGDVYRTADGGENWSRAARLAGWQIGALSFVDSSHGWLVGRPKGAPRWRIMASGDGGETWRRQASVLLDTWRSPQIEPLDAQHVWVAAGESVYATVDGGDQWARQRVPGSVAAIDFVSAERGWVGVSVGCTPQVVNGVYATTDGGATWVAQGTKTRLCSVDIHGVTFLDENVGWAVGGPRGGRILGPEMTNVAFGTTDGGTTWRQLDVGLFDYCTSVAATDPAHVWIASHAGIVSTVDSQADTVAPVTLDDSDGLWHGSDVILHLWASDIGGSGLERTEYRIDGEGEWRELVGRDLLLQPGAAGLTDGPHRVTYRSVDAAGNVEDVKSCTVRFDTVAPPRLFLRRSASVVRGGTLDLPILVRDAEPCAARLCATVEIRTASGRTVRRVTRGIAANARASIRLRCALPSGTYRFRVSAEDAAGNVGTWPRAGVLRVR
jgi:photosystem II stability/assembly factor-like uncharacterized protein